MRLICTINDAENVMKPAVHKDVRVGISIVYMENVKYWMRAGEKNGKQAKIVVCGSI
jgi:hypothetical protein